MPAPSSPPTLSRHGIDMVVEGDLLSVELPPRYEVEQLGEFLDTLAGYLHDRGELPWKMLVDISRVERTSSETRRRFARFVEAENARIARDCRAFAVVATNALQRGAITAILWLRPVVLNNKVFGDRSEAERWLNTI